jgi:sugar phosphate isomerase/epimerase
MYRRMIPFAKRYGVKLCLENLYSDFNGRPIEGCCADAAEACWYIDTLNAEAGEEIFGFCFDIGHANLVGRNVLEFIRTLGPRLTILHIHDNMGEKDSHLIPCTQWYPGGVDWDSFIQGLKEIGYRGPLAFETFRGINLLPEDVHEEGLKLVSAIGRSFRRRILAP